MSDDVVLFVHGFPHGRHLWDAQIAALGTRWRGVAPDLPGFGSTPPLDATSIDAFADTLVAKLDALGTARAVVVGLSMGGYVSLALWRRHSSRVRALVLADTRATADDAATRARREELMALTERDGLAALAEAQLPGALGATARSDRPDVVASLRALMIRSGSVTGITRALAAMRDRPDSTATLATITVPTLVLVGAEDVVTRPSEMRSMHEAIAGSRFVMIPDAGHVSNWERPAAFNAALGEFLATL